MFTCCCRVTICICICASVPAVGLAKYGFAWPTIRMEAASKPMVAATNRGASAGASKPAVESTVATAPCNAGVQLTMSCATLGPEHPPMKGSGNNNAISAQAPSLAVEPVEEGSPPGSLRSEEHTSEL